MPTPSLRRSSLFFVALPALLGSSCVENEFTERPFDDIAIVAGDFDQIEASLDRLVVSYQVYEGYICCAAYDPEVDPEDISLRIEGLFDAEDGSAELLNYDALFVNSGARGLGLVQYNGVEDDDFIVADAAKLEVIRGFVESRGRTLVVSDWGYDLVEALWPDAIDFYGDDALFDDAQAGEPGLFVASVVDEQLAEALGQDQVALEYNFSYWAVMEGVGEGTEVIMRGDVDARLSADEGVGTLTNVPVLVRFQAGAGEVIVSSFHWNAQAAGFTDGALVELIDGLNPGNADREQPAPADGEPSDTGASE